MTALVRAIVSGGVLSAMAACTNSFEVPVETPLQPKLDVSSFQRILVAGFMTGGTDEVDTNLETARLLKSQLRNNSRLQVIDADVIELTAVAQEQSEPPGDRDEADTGEAADEGQDEEETLSEEDLELYEHIFANVNYWKQLGEEYQSPLIVTGTVYFTPHQRSGMVTREQEVYDSFGRRQVVPVRTYRDRKGFILSPKFIFIDGRTGATLYTERHREEILYDTSQNTPALSSYFELMDRLLPSFLGTLSNESIRGTRILLK
jgi:hypothetical protein